MVIFIRAKAYFGINLIVAGDPARMVQIVRRGLSRMESQKEVSASERLLRKAEGMKSVGLDKDDYTF